MQSKFSLINFTYPAMLSFSIFHQKTNMNLISYFLLFLVANYCWLIQKRAFPFTYRENDYFLKYQKGIEFAGINIRDTESFNGEILKESIYGHFFRDFFIAGAFLFSTIYFFPESLNYLVSSPLIYLSILYLCLGRFYGSMIFFCFISLLLFAFTQDGQEKYFFVKLTFMSVIFLLNLSLLNSFFWKELVGNNKKINIVSQMTKLAPFVVVFMSIFVITAKFTEIKKPSLKKNLISKSMREELNEVLREHNGDQLSVKNNLSTDKIIQDKIALLNTNQEKIDSFKKKGQITENELDQIMNLMSENKKLSKDIVAGLDSALEQEIQPNGDIKNQNQELLDTLIKAQKQNQFNDLNFKGLDKYKTQQNRSKQNQDFKDNFSRELTKNLQHVNLDQKMMKKNMKNFEDFKSLEKKLDRKTNTESEREELVSRMEQLKQQLNTDFQGKLSKTVVKSEKSKPDGDQGNSSKKLFANLQKKVETTKIQQKRKNKKESILKSIGQSVLFLAFVFCLAYLFRKKKLIKQYDHLTPEQKLKIKELLRLGRILKYKTFLEELNQKYKIFHQAIEVIYYSDGKAPPAMIIPKDDIHIQSGIIKKEGRALGEIFNAYHFKKKKEFDKNEMTSFKKSYKKVMNELEIISS